ncbi:MAG: SDR family oxidoreductase [Cyclobacteriaceae bacterium]|nr:SDR family oxidoreductase [Cyclobacteriaceae bacterium]
MEKYLRNKTILITGGNRGIGRALSEYFLEHEARVAVHYNKNRELAVELVEKYGENVAVFHADLGEALEVSSLFRAVIIKMKRLDVLINNAGIAIPTEITANDIEWVNDWMKTIDVNLNAVGLLCKKAIEYFIEDKIKGRIINISSRAAFRGDTAEYMAYAASKGGIVALTRSIARAFGKKGIVAFNVAPGFVQTDMAQKFFDKYGKETALNDIALNELTTPKDIAPLIGFLASGLADHATGGTFDINAASYVH